MRLQKKESYFWTSFSDLMTSLFFVMLVLFVLTVALLHKRMVEIEQGRKATELQLEKIKEIEEAANRIDPKYFDYNRIYKKHILKIEARFGTDRYRAYDIIDQNIIIPQLVKAGQSIRDSIKELNTKYPEIQYLLIIEGQASKDRAADGHNYELSFKRAYTLKVLWELNKIDFGDKCEVLIAGSGTGGTMRENIEDKNQRFLIHIVPKPGMIEASQQ